MFQHSPPLVQPLVMMTFVLQDGGSPLYTACSKGRLDIVKTLIEAGANVNQANEVQCVGILYELTAHVMLNSWFSDNMPSIGKGLNHGTQIMK